MGFVLVLDYAPRYASLSDTFGGGVVVADVILHKDTADHHVYVADLRVPRSLQVCRIHLRFSIIVEHRALAKRISPPKTVLSTLAYLRRTTKDHEEPHPRAQSVTSSAIAHVDRVAITTKPHSDIVAVMDALGRLDAVTNRNTLL